MEADLFIVLSCNVHNQRNEIIHEDEGAFVLGIRRIPRDGKYTDSCLDELFHVVLNHGRIGGGVGSKIRVKPSCNIIWGLVLSLWVFEIHYIHPMRNGHVIPVTPCSIHRFRPVPGIIKCMNVVIHLFLAL